MSTLQTPPQTNEVRALQGPATSRRADRIWEVDAARGIAILMMVVFHAVFDLTFFGGRDINITGAFWSNFATVTAALFVSLAGVSLTLSYARAMERSPETSQLPKFIKRGLWILLWAMVLTAVTWIAMPDRYIRFGILHVIGVSILLAYPFIRLRLWNLLIGIGVISWGPVVSAMRVDHPWFIPFGIRPIQYASLDYQPLIPWFGVMLIGLALGSLLYPAGRRRFTIPDLSSLYPVRGLAFLGQHSLLIYLVHQPILLVLLTMVGIIELSSWAPV